MAYEDVGIKVFIGDQADRYFWARLKHAAPTIDILIDDGGHLPEQQRITLEEMLPYIAPGGVYLCEDIHGVFNTFAAYVQGLANGLNSAWAPGEIPEGTSELTWTASNFQAAIKSIHLYPYVAVIEKRERSLDRLIAPSMERNGYGDKADKPLEGRHVPRTRRCRNEFRTKCLRSATCLRIAFMVTNATLF